MMMSIKQNLKLLWPTCRQPSNAGGFRRVAFTKPANVKGKVNIKQVKPLLRLPAIRYGQVKKTQTMR
jgi:hypothetical protein